MLKPVDIRFRHMSPSPAITQRVLSEISELEQLCGELTSCRVTIELPHRHHRQGNKFHVLVDAHAAGLAIIAANTHDDDPAFEDAHVAVSAQFAVIRRRLREAVLRRRTHPVPG